MALWTGGSAALLAGLSWASWLSARTERALRATLTVGPVRAALGSGLLAICAVLALESVAWWERGLFLAFGMWFAHQAFVIVASSDACAAPQQSPRVTPTHALRGSPTHVGMRIAEWCHVVEPWLLSIVAPFLLFPSRVSLWVVWLPALPWMGRVASRASPTRRTPLDWPILVLLGTVAVGVRASLDLERTTPKLLGISLGFVVLYAIVNQVRDLRGAWKAGWTIVILGIGVSTLAMVGTDWAGTGGLSLPLGLQHWPQVVATLGGSLSSGFNPNEVGATLTLFVPFLTSLLLFGYLEGSPGEGQHGVESPTPERKNGRHLGIAILAGGLLLMLIALGLTRSRSAWIGTGAAFLIVASQSRRWSVPALVLTAVTGASVYLRGGAPHLLEALFAVGAERNVATRLELWRRVLYAIRDFPYTGVGLNMLSPTINTLYPFHTLSPAQVLESTHAHNIYLQVAVDLGLPGLVAYLGVLTAFGMCAWYVSHGAQSGQAKALNVGLVASMAGYHIYGLADCITLGAKPGVIQWAMWGLMAALANMSSPHAGAGAAGSTVAADG